MYIHKFIHKTSETTQSVYVHYRSTLRNLLAEGGFDQLTDETRNHILLQKATRYEEALQDVTDVVTGNRPEQMRFRSAGTLCTFTCTDKEFRDGPHNSGTEKACKSCAVTMTKHVAETLDRIFTRGEQPCSLTH